MATIRERKGVKGSSFMAEVRLKGFLPQTKTFQRKTDAKQWVLKTEAAMRENRYPKNNDARTKTVGELIERYTENVLPSRGRDKKTVEGELKWWKEQIGSFVLADVTPQILSDYRECLLKEPINAKNEKKPPKFRSPATVIRYLASLSVCFSYAIHDLGWIENNPVLKVRKPSLSNERVRYLSEEERERLLKACKKKENNKHGYLYVIVVLALSTGARMSEIMYLQWKDIDFQNPTIRLEQTKNGERRAIPLSSHAYELIRQLSKVRQINSSYLFPRADGQKPFEIKKYWKKAVDDADIENFRFHDLRHTAASYLAMNGASTLEIAHILGHKQLKMVKRYAHLAEQHTRSVLDRMNALQFQVT